MTQTGFYAATQALLEAMPGRFVKVVPHDADDPDSSDLLWLDTTDDEMSEGELIKIGLLCNGVWDVMHDLAYKFGGWPTVWSYQGNIGAVINELTAYLAELDALKH